MSDDRIASGLFSLRSIQYNIVEDLCYIIKKFAIIRLTKNYKDNATPQNLDYDIDELKIILFASKNNRDKVRKNITKNIIKVCR